MAKETSVVYLYPSKSQVWGENFDHKKLVITTLAANGKKEESNGAPNDTYPMIKFTKDLNLKQQQLIENF